MFSVYAHSSLRSCLTAAAQRTEPSCSHTSNQTSKSFQLNHKRPCAFSPISVGKQDSRMLSFLNRNLNPYNWGSQAQKTCAQSQEQVGITELADPNGTRKEVFETAANIILEDYEAQQPSEEEIAQVGSSRNFKPEAESTGNGSSTESKSKAQDVDWGNVPTLPDDLQIAQRHPLDPHKPNFSHLLPEPLRPYPTFEGWFIRLWDPQSGGSAAVIMATNYATDESQVTLIFAPGRESNQGKNGAAKLEVDRDSVRYGYTYAVAVKTKDAKFTEKEHPEKWEANRGQEPEGFEWEANGIGRIVVTPHTTDLDFTVEGYRFKAHLTKELLWDPQKSEKGPEGWAGSVAIIPTHWYVYSLGSTAEYSFSNSEKGIESKGNGYGHVEKNWGQTFPAGHVWLQAFNADNTSQVCCAGAYFKTPNEKLSSPHIFLLGYRSPKLQLDFRTNDLGIVFKDIHFAPLESRFSVTAVGPSHTVEVTAYAPYDTFSDAILAPVTKVDWEPACRESYVATAEIKVYEHLAWGLPGTTKLVEEQTFEFAGLEFGEDLLTEALKSQGGDQNN